jgi:hypothetical protein
MVHSKNFRCSGGFTGASETMTGRIARKLEASFGPQVAENTPIVVGEKWGCGVGA